MNKELKIAAVALITIAGGAAMAQACTGCGCSAPKKKAAPAQTECATGVCALTTEQTNPQNPGKAHAHDLTTVQMVKAVATQRYVILDARGDKYFNGELIPGATHLPSSSDEAAIAAVIPSKETKIITYCSNLKCPASDKLATKLIALGYKNVSEYPEGLAGWKAAGGEVVK